MLFVLLNPGASHCKVERERSTASEQRRQCEQHYNGARLRLDHLAIGLVESERRGQGGMKHTGVFVHITHHLFVRVVAAREH